jgi:hypothetical protein
MVVRHRIGTSRDRIVMDKTFATMAMRMALTLGVSAASLCAAGASAAVTAPEDFASPQQAVDAFVAAARDNDLPALLKVLGPAGRDLISSGDPVADKEMRARFIKRYGTKHTLEKADKDKVMLVIGTEDWPFAIPIVMRHGHWHFDAAAGKEEILDRRVGGNELSAMDVCRSFVQAQRDYAADMTQEHKPREFSQKFVSSPGQHDGLYWAVQPGEKESPIGALMAHAEAEGYLHQNVAPTATRAPYHGYYFKLLMRQGAAAPGGARDYVVDGHMTGGFAMLAYPAKYGDSGVMTFIVNQDDIVYQKNLGPDTATAAPAIDTFNPDMTWRTR